MKTIVKLFVFFFCIFLLQNNFFFSVFSEEESENVARYSDRTGRRAGEKKTLRIKGIDYTFCWCPAGTFMMGSPESEKNREDDEKQHEVRLTEGFWMLESEVTQSMWESVMGTTIQEQTNKNTLSPKLYGVGPDYPMYNVSGAESIEFCKKLSKLSQSEIRLPTEAEWEYACRAGSTGEYGGTGNLDDMGWYGHKEKYGDKLGNSGERTHEVKTKQANAWGLYDMHGNVWEWCNDWLSDYPSDAVTDPTDPESGSILVSRGGSWCHSAGDCRSASRFWLALGYRYCYRYCYSGFRLAAVPKNGA